MSVTPLRDRQRPPYSLCTRSSSTDQDTCFEENTTRIRSCHQFRENGSFNSGQDAQAQLHTSQGSGILTWTRVGQDPRLGARPVHSGRMKKWERRLLPMFVQGYRDIWNKFTEQTGYCKTSPRPFSTQTDDTVSFCFVRFSY